MNAVIVLQLLLIVLLAWTAAALLVLPVAARIARAGGRADADALRQHEALRATLAA